MTEKVGLCVDLPFCYAGYGRGYGKRVVERAERVDTYVEKGIGHAVADFVGKA